MLLPEASARSRYARRDVRLIFSFRSISRNDVPRTNSRMITLMSVIVAFLFAISLWYLFSNHKVTSVKPKATLLKLLPFLGWHWLTSAGGTFVSATAGTFQSDEPVHLFLLRAVHLFLIYPVHLKVIQRVHLIRCYHNNTATKTDNAARLHFIDQVQKTICAFLISPSAGCLD